MKNIKNRFYLLILSLLVVAACTEFDDTLPDQFTSDVIVPGTQTGGGDDAVAPADGLSGAYAQLRSAGTANHGGYFSVQGLPSDEMLIAAKGGDWFDGGVLIQLHRHTYTPLHGFINGTWVQTYAAINAANELLVTLDANQTAQVRALRAYFIGDYLICMDR